jgi:hypothetical protein
MKEVVGMLTMFSGRIAHNGEICAFGSGTHILVRFAIVRTKVFMFYRIVNCYFWNKWVNSIAQMVRYPGHATASCQRAVIRLLDIQQEAGPKV